MLPGRILAQPSHGALNKQQPRGTDGAERAPQHPSGPAQGPLLVLNLWVVTFPLINNLTLFEKDMRLN